MTAKLTHKEASYTVPGTPRRHCGVCTMYRFKDPHCTLVEEPIESWGVCKYFERKEVA